MIFKQTATAIRNRLRGSSFLSLNVFARDYNAAQSVKNPMKSSFRTFFKTASAQKRGFFSDSLCLFLLLFFFFSFRPQNALAHDDLYILGGGGGGGINPQYGGCAGGQGGYSGWDPVNQKDIRINLNGGNGASADGGGYGGGGGGYIGDGSVAYDGSGKSGYYDYEQQKQYPGKGGAGFGGAQNGEDGFSSGGRGGSAFYNGANVKKNKIVIMSGAPGSDGGAGGSAGFKGGDVNVKELVMLDRGAENGAVFSAHSLSAQIISLNASYSDNESEITPCNKSQPVSGGLNVKADVLNIVDNNTRISGNGAIGGGVFFNTVNLAGMRHLDALEYLSGGFDAFGTLNVLGKGASMSGNLLAAGKNINFFLDGGSADKDTMLFIKGRSDISGSKIGITIASEKTALKKGDKIILISAAEGLDGVPCAHKVNGFHGAGLVYKFDYGINEKEMTATVSDAGLNPQTKAFSEGMAAGMILLEAGGELIGEFAVEEAARAVKGESFFSVFSAASAGKSRTHTGSHVDVNGFSVMGGLASGLIFSEDNKLAFGAFLEHGHGDYNSYNNFHGFAGVRGDGDSFYTGFGILGHVDRENFYFALAGRAGEIKNDFSSRDLGIMGAKTSYSTDCLYYGLNAGGGYVFKPAGKFGLDAGVKYSFIYQDSDDTSLSSGETLKFDISNSHRLQAQTKAYYSAGRFFTPYAAAKFEYEFSGEIGAQMHGFSIDSPSLKGGTGVGEIGVSAKTGSVSADLGLRGYCGKREGFDSMLKLIYHIGG